MGEDRQRLTSGERGGGSEHGVEAGVSCSCGDRLGDRVVVTDEIGLVDTEASAHDCVGQVEHLEGDEHPAHAPPDFERVNAVVDEMAEQFGPRSLLLARPVPYARFAGTVVAARPASGICTGCELVPGRALMSEATGDLSARCGGDRVGEAHT